MIREEYLEFEVEVFKREQNPERMMAELIQIAAMCQRAAEDLDLYERGERNREPEGGWELATTKTQMGIR